jgi:ankyrin repeat protein
LISANRILKAYPEGKYEGFITGDRETVEALIDKHANIDAAENTYGWTALIYAIWGSDHFIVRYLLEFYPDVSVKDKDGRTALDHVKATGDFEMMLLINARPVRGHHKGSTDFGIQF